MQVRCGPSFFVSVRLSLLVLRVQFVQSDMRRIPSQRCDSQAYANKHDRDRSQELLSLHDQARDDRVSPKLIRRDNLPATLQDTQWRQDLNGWLARQELMHPTRSQAAPREQLVFVVHQKVHLFVRRLSQSCRVGRASLHRANLHPPLRAQCLLVKLVAGRECQFVSRDHIARRPSQASSRHLKFAEACFCRSRLIRQRLFDRRR
ncbi:unannotated protein [freshwater metagenome]|uniref:Unannotated protein n=1 Tax=freshwater metagenome TaxID=449393 RepID=A0A6J6MGZ3_9ZZZZ